MKTSEFFEKYSKVITFIKGDATFGLFKFGPLCKQFTVNSGEITRVGKVVSPKEILDEYKEWKRNDKIRKAEEKAEQRELKAFKDMDDKIRKQIQSWGWTVGGIFSDGYPSWSIRVEDSIVFVRCEVLRSDAYYDTLTFTKSIRASDLTEDALVEATLDVGKQVTDFWEDALRTQLNGMRSAVYSIMPDNKEI